MTEAGRPALLQVADLRKTFPGRRTLLGRREPGVAAVAGISFDVAAGECLAVVGESGAGKSTVGRLVLRLIEPDAGRIVLDGTDVRALRGEALRAIRKDVQMIFQDPFGSLDPRVAIGESVAEPLLVHFGTPAAERARTARELLDRVGVPAGYVDRFPAELSGGQLQRVAIARALSLRPKLIVCDEPVAALDVSVQAQVLNLMGELRRELGLSYLFISHDLSLVEVVADRVLVMRRGEVVEEGTISAVYRSPQHLYTQELLAAIPAPVPRRVRTPLAVGGRLNSAGR